MRCFNFVIILIQLFFFTNLYANNIIVKDHFLQLNKNTKLYVKEKFLSLKKNEKINKNKIIVLLPPLSIPSVEAFDVPNLSFMNVLAQEGYDVWGIDFIGQGKSSYPKVMQDNPPANGVFPLQQQEAVIQLKFLIDYLKKEKSVSSVYLLGWSWGAVVAASYSTQFPNDVDKLVLAGAMHSFLLPQFTKSFMNKDNSFNLNLASYQIVPWAAIDSHWQMMEDNKKLVNENDKNAVKKIYENLDKGSFIKGSLRRAMGPMKDLFEIWNERPVFDITKVTKDTLVIYGNQDMFADKKLFQKLINAKSKKEIVIKNATHWIFYEKNRFEFYNGIINFLNNRSIQ